MRRERGFDYCFRATNENEDEREACSRASTLLVLANKQDLENSAKPDEVSKALDLDAYQETGTTSAVCPVVGDAKKQWCTGPRVERAIDLARAAHRR